MCGIAGYYDRSSNSGGLVGTTVLGMLRALGCRGPDSAGVALYRAPLNDELVLQVKLGDPSRSEETTEKVLAKVSALSKPKSVSTTAGYLRLTIDGSLDPGPVAAAVESAGSEVEVVSMGRRLEIVKQVGSPDRLEDTFHVSEFKGSHGIGHTRMSTESKVDLSHSQPFWGHGCPDLAIVHNGHITNYHKLRRQYEQHGVRFYTENDSEIIGVYVAQGLSSGRSLEEVLRAALVDWDGSFSCLVSTADAMGFVKGSFAHKPLLFGETDGFAVVATEEIAVRAAFGSDLTVREAGAGGSQGMAELACEGRTIRDINAEIRRLLKEAEPVTVTSPEARHNLGVALLDPGEVLFDGSVGYYCAGLIDGATVRIKGSAGWGLAESMLSGEVIVEGNAGNSAGAAIRGGVLVTQGDSGARTGVSMKNGLIIVTGSCGYMSGFMGQGGRMIVCGDAAEAFADSMYETICFVGGEIADLGNDAILSESTDEDKQFIDTSLSRYLPAALRGALPAAGDFKKVVSGRKLWNFDKSEWKTWEQAL